MRIKNKFKHINFVILKKLTQLRHLRPHAGALVTLGVV